VSSVPAANEKLRRSARTTISDWTGANIPLIVLLLGAVAVCLVFAYFDIKITARVLGVFFVAEVGVLLIFAIAVLVQGGAHGFTAAPLNPLDVLKNKGAIAVFGAAAPGVALFGAFWSWVGFEMAPNYGEESRQPRRIFSRATFGTLFALGFVYVLVSYAFTIGWGTGGAAQGVHAQFSGKTISAFYPLTGRYFGASLTDAFRFLIMTSSFACTLAFFNTSARYVFALGRERILPSALGRTHKTHNTPHLASAVVAAAIAIWILLFYASDSSTNAALLKLATWTPIVGVFGLLLVQALTSFAIVRYFRVVAPEHPHPVKTLIAPLVGGVLMVFSAWLLFHNRGALSGASGAAFIRYGFWLIPLTFVLGIGGALWFRSPGFPRARRPAHRRRAARRQGPPTLSMTNSTRERTWGPRRPRPRLRAGFCSWFASERSCWSGDTAASAGCRVLDPTGMLVVCPTVFPSMSTTWRPAAGSTVRWVRHGGGWGSPPAPGDWASP
jgi:amino acid transporter